MDWTLMPSSCWWQRRSCSTSPTVSTTPLIPWAPLSRHALYRRATHRPSRPSTWHCSSAGAAPCGTVAKRSNPTAGEAVICAAFAAIAWNYITWYVGMPSSSSHAIIGGLVGAGLAAGFRHPSWSSVRGTIGIIASPLVAINTPSSRCFIYLLQKVFQTSRQPPDLQRTTTRLGRRAVVRTRRKRRPENDRCGSGPCSWAPAGRADLR